MMYIKDRYGNKTELNPTFEIVGLPYQQEYSTTQIPGLDGEIETSEPVVSSANRSIVGKLVELTLEEARAKRDELADICGRGKIKVGHEEEGWFVEGQCISFDHKYSAKSGKCVAEVSITLKCDDPHQKAEEVVEELIITPSDYSERIEMLNPHPAANLRFGTFDVDTGEKISDESNWIINPAAIYTQGIGHGFTFDCYRGFSLSAYAGSGVREFKVFVDGVFQEEVAYSGTSEFDIRYSTKFNDSHKHEVTILLSQMTLYVDYIYFVPANLPVVINPGTVSDYPVIEVEPADTEALFSPLGKKVGDDTHPFELDYFKSSNPLALTPESTGITFTQTGYDEVAFLDGDTFLPATSIAERYAVARLKWDLKSPQSPYYGMTATEIKDHMQSILSELWGYARGAIEVGDPSFESGVNGFVYLNNVTVDRSSEWAKTGVYSLKIVSNGSSQWANAGKSYGNHAGEKITAKLTIYNPPTGGTQHSILAKWRDMTHNVDFSLEHIDLALGQEGTYELETLVPANCDNVRLYIYPAAGAAEPATIYIDDVTATANGIDVRIWTDGDHWSSSSRFHDLDFPSLVAWDLDVEDNPSRFVDSDGMVCFLVMAMYPSDGISSSAVYIDHCRLGTVMSYAKLGADAIVNYGGNLLENGWGEYYADRKYGQASSPINQTLFDHAGEKLVYPGQKITLSVEGRRDAEAIKNDICPALLILHFLKDGTYISYVVSANLFAELEANKWERKTVTTNLKDDPDMGIIKIYYYRSPNTTLPGKVGIQNAVLSDGEKIIKLQPQDLRMLEFSEDIVLAKGDLISVDTKRREVDKNGGRLYQLINQSFKFFPLMIFGGLNHFKINHTGANMKIRMKYQPKWR